MPNLKQIVCTFDFSEESHSALTLAGILALQSSACLHVVHIVPYLAISSGLFMMGQPTIYSGFFDYAQDKIYITVLKETVTSSLPDGMKVSFHIIQGGRIYQLVNLLQSLNADLFITELSKNHLWWKWLFSPPILTRIIQRSPCPILTLPAMDNFNQHNLYENI